MSRKCNRKARLRLCRRLDGSDLALTSGIRPLDSKCKLTTPPGVHSAKRTRLSDYGNNLREKQRVCITYGLSDKQLRRYYTDAIKEIKKYRKQIANAQAQKLEGENLFSLILKPCERRLDNIVFRMGFAATRREARQLVNHRAILVNDQLVDKPGFLLKPADRIEIRPKSKNQTRIQAAIDLAKQRPDVAWVNVNFEGFQGTVTRFPEPSEFPQDFQPQQVIEFYSR